MRFLPTSLLLLLGGCSNGLTPLNTLDTDGDSGDETGFGDPIDSGNHDGTNRAPIADAGSDQLVVTGDVVSLDGSGSSDPDDDAIRYYWRLTSKPSGSSASLINETRVDPEFWADREGEFLLTLDVDDGELSASDQVLITAENPNGTPTASAGSDQSVTVGDKVQLDGSDSSDPDGDALSFQWTLTSTPSGSAATLGSSTTALPSFTADKAGTYTVRLVVSDGVSDSAPDTVNVSAAEASNDDDDGGLCLAAQSAGDAAGRRWRRGDAAAAWGLLLLPFLVLGYRRRS